MPPRIDVNRCNGCGLCVFYCGVDALAFDVAKYKAKLVDPCVDCFICEDVCPEEAIRIVVKHRQAPENGDRAGGSTGSLPHRKEVKPHAAH